MPSMKKTVVAALATAGSAHALTESVEAAYNRANCLYSVTGLGAFTDTLNIDWNGLTVVSGVSNLFNGLLSSTYTVANNYAPFSRRFDAANIGFDTSFFGAVTNAITLTVPGGQKSGPISVAQITTGFNDILYGSVRTVAQVSNVPGTTHGFSFYSNDTQEIDFAFITSDVTKVHYTNEPVNAQAPATSYVDTAPSDASSAYHEYRVDWAPGVTRFYIDGVFQQNITTNVPTTPGFWLWNNWSNGNSWAGGPPNKDNTLKIRSITAYWNRTAITKQMTSKVTSRCGLLG